MYRVHNDIPDPLLTERSNIDIKTQDFHFHCELMSMSGAEGMLNGGCGSDLVVSDQSRNVMFMRISLRLDE